jgi:hypothetical protein
MNQRYHVVFEGGNSTTRRPWKGAKVEKYSSSGCVRDGVVIPAMFGEHEKRQFLEVLGDFSVVTIEVGKTENGSKTARQILEEGLVITDPDTGEKSNWYVAGYYVRDDGVIFIMTPQPMDDSQFFNALKLHIDLENEWSNSFKVGKYLKRLYSHHRKYIEGVVVSNTDSVIMVRMPSGRIWSVRYANYKIADGMNLVSPSVLRELGFKRAIGQGLRITALSPKGFSKGHAVVIDGLKHDLVLFNSKTLLKGDKFIFGMDWLHSGALYTDAQSVVNFQMERARYSDGERCMTAWHKIFDEQIIDACQDQEKLRNMLRFYTSEFHKYEDGENAGDYIEQEKDWALLRALRGGIHFQQFPGLIRKIKRLFSEKVRDCDFKVRIPVPSEVGGARYAIVDPTIFDINGDPTLEGQLSGNTVYCEGYTGDIAFHRQPNGHRGEHHVATAVANSTLEELDKDGCFIFLSRNMVLATMEKLGGGDQDDRLVYYKDPVMVDHFKQLAPYPKPVLPKSEKKQAEPGKYANAFLHRLHRKPVYDRAQLLVMLDQQKRSGITIGQVVNPLIIDSCISDNLEYLIETMPRYMPMDIPKIKAAYEYTKAYQKNTLQMPAWLLETVIDATKKDGRDSLSPAIAKAIKMYNETFQIIPEFCTRGKYDGRVPQSRRGANAPQPVITPIDEMLGDMEDLRIELDNIINRISWQMLEPLPLEIVTYPARDAGLQVAHAIRAYYHLMRAKFNAGIEPTGDGAETKKRINAYVQIDAAVYDEFHHHPFIIDAMVYLYAIIYEQRRPDAPLDENGKPIQFPDGLLWGPRMSGLTMKMLEKVGLAGRYAEVDFEPKFKHMKHNSIEATIEDGVVTMSDVPQPVGLVDPLADGKNKTIERGFTKVPAAYEPATRIMAMTVVNGWKQRGIAANETDVQEWLSHVHEKVTLVPYIYDNNGVDEHAVRIMLGDREFGNLSREDAPYVTQPTVGALAPGKTPRTMEVLVSR